MFKGLESPIVSTMASRDGRRFLAGANNGIVWLGELDGDRRIWPLRGHSSDAVIWDVAFTADGRHAVSSGADGHLIYWDLDTRRERNRTRVNGCQVRAFEVMPDGRQVVFATQFLPGEPGDGGIIGFWDVTSAVYRPGPRGAAHLGLDLLPDGRIVTSDIDGLARLWRPDPAVARARKLVEAAKPAEAVAEYARAVAGRPSDARLLIERGRLLAELGRSSEADADFSAAAALAPGNAQLFLDAGWWIAGPYPPDLEVPPALTSGPAPDPSEPPPPAPDGPRLWRRAPIGIAGTVNLRRDFRSDHVGADALAIVYAASRHEVVLLTGSDDGMRLWLNGRPVDEIPHFTDLAAHALIATLQPGRNTIQARVINDKGPYHFDVRFSEAPVDYYRAFVATKQWDRGRGPQAGPRPRPERWRPANPCDRGGGLRQVGPLEGGHPGLRKGRRVGSSE